MTSTSGSSFSKNEMIMLVAAMSMRNKSVQPAVGMPPVSSSSALLGNSLGANMPSIGGGLSSLTNGASSVGLPGVGMPGFTGGLADRLGISQFFPQGFNPFSGNAVAELVTMGAGMGGGSMGLGAGMGVPASPASSMNPGAIAALMMVLEKQKEKKAENGDDKTTGNANKNAKAKETK